MTDEVETTLKELDEATRARIESAGVQGMRAEIERIKAEQAQAEQDELHAQFIRQAKAAIARGARHEISAIRQKLEARGYRPRTIRMDEFN